MASARCKKRNNGVCSRRQTTEGDDLVEGLISTSGCLTKGRSQCFRSHIGLLPFRHSVHGAGACGHRMLQVKRS